MFLLSSMLFSNHLLLLPYVYAANASHISIGFLSRVPSPKNITMNMILRSSRRFKKAKHAATQLQLEDTESQPVDIVPDSQVNQ
ncbi:hypothetical protein HYC85_021177 [Camellia sinensis]|uniref:Secreted protein n=1 Tax=Camellia sinensis TaxID=4442 RepID=A0A7J7GGX5_CAMSI|nr:hypothetical protein HYC85_021177 [Camellia sinensis]